MQLTMEQLIFTVNSHYKTKSFSQFPTNFRTFFPERSPPNKTTTRKNVKKFDMDGISLNMPLVQFLVD